MATLGDDRHAVDAASPGGSFHVRWFASETKKNNMDKKSGNSVNTNKINFRTLWKMILKMVKHDLKHDETSQLLHGAGIFTHMYPKNHPVM